MEFVWKTLIFTLSHVFCMRINFILPFSTNAGAAKESPY